MLCFIYFCCCLLFEFCEFFCQGRVFVLHNVQFFFGLSQLASFVKNLLSAFKDLCVKLSLFLFKLGCKLIVLTFIRLLFFFERSFQLVIFFLKGFTLFIVLYYVCHYFGFVEAERRGFEFAVCRWRFFLFCHYCTP